MNGKRCRRITTKGWEIQVLWEDGSSSWIPLNEIKEANPIEVAEYASAQEISEEPAFAWWVTKVPKRRDKVIKQVKSRVLKKGMKFGILIPSTVEEAYRLDKQNGNDLWRKAIEKELKGV